MQRCSSGADHQFGPRVAPQCRPFDFTLLFEQIFFTVVPNTLFLLLCALRSKQLFAKPSLTRHGVLHWAKLVGYTMHECRLIHGGLTCCTVSFDCLCTNTFVAAHIDGLLICAKDGYNRDGHYLGSTRRHMHAACLAL